MKATPECFKGQAGKNQTVLGTNFIASPFMQ
jgi:hypothetical protein